MTDAERATWSMRIAAEKNFRFAIALVIGLGSLLLMGLLTGCSKQAYVVTSSTEQQQAPGHFVVAPKVDIMLAEDDTGSMYEIYDSVSWQMPLFLEGLQTKGWDYHFATIPLTTDRTLDQVLASYHDSNWGSLWRQPYPGAEPFGPGTLSSSVFTTPDLYTDFLTLYDVNNSLNGKEPAFENMRVALYDRAAGTEFLRSDALLVILALSNGEDTSGVNFCRRSDGYVGPCDQVGQPDGSMASSFDYYKDQFKALKTDSSQVKFHAAVADKKMSDCLGGPSYAGTRYKEMAKALGGESYDICSQSISQVLDSLSSSLQSTKIALRTRYIFIQSEPDVSTIVLTKYDGGSASQASVIPQDADNGWTYAGYVTDVYAIDSPTEMNLSSGFAIELHGSAKLSGDDTADVTYKPAGATDSVAN